jgi:hypothetical protein
MCDGDQVVSFPGHKARATRRSAERQRVERFGLRDPGYILRLPKESAGDYARQCALCDRLASFAAGWRSRLMRSRKPLSKRELAGLVLDFDVHAEAETLQKRTKLST